MLAYKTAQINKQDANVSYYGTGWSGKASGVAVQIETASNQLNGISTFGTNPDDTQYGLSLADTSGVTAICLENGTHYQYDKRLDASTTEDAVDGFGLTSGGIVDTSTGGALAANKYIRVVVNTKNVKDVTGVNLKVYAKDLTATINPPSDRCYVDPQNGKIVLPRPTYWNKMDTIESLAVATIGEEFGDHVYFGYAPTLTKTGAKFGYGIRWYCASTQDDGVYAVFRMQGLTYTLSHTGVLAYWVGGSGSDYVNHEIHLGAFRVVHDHVNNLVKLYVGDTLTSAAFTYGVTAQHVYIVWDEDKALTGSKSVRVFMNGTEKVSSTDNLADWYYYESLAAKFVKESAHNFFTTLDNLKYFTDAVSEDPSWDYNSGTGRELALHPVYGSSASYVPSTVQVGYFHLSTALGAVSMPKPGADATIQLEDIALYSNGIGYFGSTNVMKNSSYTDILENSDFAYGKRLDASTTQDATYGYGLTSGGIYDPNASGAFTSGKYMRIVNNGKNATDATGMNCQIFAKDLSDSSNLYPLANTVYVDPLRSKIVIPRPIYFSKMESYANMVTSPEYYDPEYPPTATATGVLYNAEAYTTDFSKFGNGLFLNQYTIGANLSPSTYTYTRTVYPRNGLLNWNKGTFCSWTKGYVTGTTVNIGYFTSNVVYTVTFALNTYASLYYYQINNGAVVAYAQLVVNGSSVGTYNITNNTLYHFGVVWDRSAGLSGSKTIIVYINGTERLSSTTVFPDNSAYNLTYSLYTYSFGDGQLFSSGASYSQLGTDNVKLYNHVVTEGFAWDYNGGAGNESATHNVYGSTAYIPKLVSTYNGGVGYYTAGGAGVYNRIVFPTTKKNNYVGILFRGSDEAFQAKVTIVDDANGADVVRDKYIDTFRKAFVYGSSQYKTFIFWYKLPTSTHQYSMYLYNGGAVAGRTTYGNYPNETGMIQYEAFLLTSELEEGDFDFKLQLWHSDYPSELYFYVLSTGQNDLLRRTYYNGDNATKQFLFYQSTLHASEFIRVSVDGGTTWMLPGDIDFTWGSNLTYDDSQLDANGHFGFVFVEAPSPGSNNIIVEWIPKIDTARIVSTLLQPTDASGAYVDTRVPVCVQDFSIEFVA